MEVSRFSRQLVNVLSPGTPVGVDVYGPYVVGGGTVEVWDTVTPLPKGNVGELDDGVGRAAPVTVLTEVVGPFVCSSLSCGLGVAYPTILSQYGHR